MFNHQPGSFPLVFKKRSLAQEVVDRLMGHHRNKGVKIEVKHYSHQKIAGWIILREGCQIRTWNGQYKYQYEIDRYLDNRS